MHRFRKCSLVVLACLVLSIFMAATPSHAVADGTPSPVHIERVSLYYAFSGAWLLKNTYAITMIGNDVIDDDGFYVDYQELVESGHQVYLKRD